MASHEGYESVHACSEKLYYMGILSICYYTTVVTRQIILLLLMKICAKDISLWHWKARIAFLVMDTLLLPALTFYSTAITRGPALKECWGLRKGRSDPSVRSWIAANAYISVAYGFVLTVFIFCIWCCICANGFSDFTNEV